MQLFTSNKTISLCMIVRNEEDLLPRCLESVRGLVDEIIVVDTGSTDNTVAIAEAHGARVIYHPWGDSFAEARNVGLDAATSGWVIVLDADEEWRGGPALRSVVDHPLAVIRVPITNHMGKHGDVTHHGDRIFPASCRYVGRIHEQLTDPSGRFGFTHIGGFRITHRGYDPAIVEARGKNERNLRLLLAQDQETPNDPHIKIHMGHTLELMGRLYHAAEQYRLALYHADLEGITIAWEHAAARLIACLYQSGEIRRGIVEGRELCRHHEVEHPGFWLNYGLCKSSGGFHELAAASFQKAIGLRGNRTVYQVDEGVATWKGFACLGDALMAAGRNYEAEAVILTALQNSPPPHEVDALSAKLRAIEADRLADRIEGLTIFDMPLAI